MAVFLELVAFSTLALSFPGGVGEEAPGFRWERRSPSEHHEGDHHCDDGEGQGDAEHPTDDPGGLTLPGLGRSLDLRLSVGHPQSQRNGKCKVWLSPHRERRPWRWRTTVSSMRPQTECVEAEAAAEAISDGGWR